MRRMSIVLTALVMMVGSMAFAAPATSLIAPGEPADLTLLFTGDVIGYLDPCG